MAIKEKLGVSIIGKLEGVTETFVENEICYLEFRIVKDDYDEIDERVRIILKEKEKSGIVTRTVHLPQKSSFDLSQSDENLRLAALENQKRVVRHIFPLRPEVLVLHPCAGEVKEEVDPERVEALIKSLKEFSTYCAAMGMKVAVENLTNGMVQTSADMLPIMEAVGENVGICFDVNHLLKETHRDFIRKVGKYIITMHVSDNDGIQERHFLPGDGVINWKKLFEELSKIGYDGTMIVESGRMMSEFPASVTELCEKWERIH